MKQGMILLITAILIFCACSSPTEPTETARAKVVYGEVYDGMARLDSARISVDCLTCKADGKEYHWETKSDSEGQYEVIGTAISHAGHQFSYGCTRVRYLPTTGYFKPRYAGPFLLNIEMVRQ